jgi:hydroxymethylpyrimidine/phosphomethylpyrimidine kinase
VIAAFGCYAMTATTALTVQDTQGVYDIHEVPSSFVKRQIETCINDIGVDIVKTGTLLLSIRNSHSRSNPYQ